MTEQRDLHNLLILKTAMLEGMILKGGKVLSDIMASLLSKDQIRSFFSETLDIEQM